MGKEDTQALGWYEKDPTASSGYALTSDNSVTVGKQYFSTAKVCLEVVKKKPVV